MSKTVKAGDNGKVRVPNKGTAITGFRGRSVAGIGGRAASGEQGIIAIKYYSKDEDLCRFKVGLIGECGITPNQLYRLDENNEFTPVEE